MADEDGRALERAISLHRSGATNQAIRQYRAVLRKHPGHVEALRLIAHAYSQVGDCARAITSLQQAVAAKPDLPDGHFNLGVLFQSASRHEEATAHYAQAAASSPRDFRPLNNLGNTLMTLGRNAEAVEQFERALALQPDLAQAHMNLGNALLALDRMDDAVRSHKKAVALNPGLAEAHLNLGTALLRLMRHEEATKCFERAIALKPGYAEAHMNMGNVLQAQRRAVEALPWYERAILLKPNLADAHMNFGNALQLAGCHEQSIRSYQHALALRPGHAQTEKRIGDALQAMNRYEEAITQYEKTLALAPGHAETHLVYGNALSALGREDEARARYDRAIAANPDYAEAKRNKGLHHLYLGEFAAGWALDHHRWELKIDAECPRLRNEPHWNGEYVDGLLVVWGEQGLGDQILYASMADELVGLTRTAAIEVEPRLVPLFKRSFPALAIAELPGQAAGPADAQVPVGSLGKFLRRSWADFPRRDSGYLVADPKRTRPLRARLVSEGQSVIGLSWISTAQLIGKSKSAALRDFAPLFALPDCRFIDLQYTDTSAERAAVERDLGMRVERLDHIDNKNDIDGLAALISACDLVVTVSNTTAHLAGALGRPTLVLLPYGQARLWYWFRDRDDSPWYPRVRIVRQGAGQRWTEVIGVARDLVSKMTGAM